MYAMARRTLSASRPEELMPYRAYSRLGRIILQLRWPVMLGLIVATCLQLIAAITPIIKPDAINMPDLIPPLNTAILALLWWRISQLEKISVYHRDRLDKISEHEDKRDDREDKPRAKR